MDLLQTLDTLVFRRLVAQFLTPADWDALGPCSKLSGSLAKVHNTGFFFPGDIPAASYSFPRAPQVAGTVRSSASPNTCPSNSDIGPSILRRGLYQADKEQL